jgi:uncharacterized glyoxalase superfamily metalloenzyme YdcJ
MKIFTGQRGGIFQSNLGNEIQARSHGNASREAFEEALGCPVHDEFALINRRRSAANDVAVCCKISTLLA